MNNTEDREALAVRASHERFPVQPGYVDERFVEDVHRAEREGFRLGWLAARQPAPVDAETTTEWGVRWSEDCVEPYPSGEDSWRATVDDDTGTPVQRTVLVLTPWREVQDRG